MRETSTIEINMDKECVKCGKKGACQNGLCITCNGKITSERLSLKVGPNVIAKMLSMIHDHFVSYQKEMDNAYRLLEEDPLKISLGLKLSPGNNGINIETTISFTKEKISDKTTGFASEIQQSLFKE